MPTSTIFPLRSTRQVREFLVFIWRSCCSCEMWKCFLCHCFCFGHLLGMLAVHLLFKLKHPLSQQLLELYLAYLLYGKILGFSLSMHFIRNISTPTHASKGHRVTETHQPKYFSNLKTVQLRDVHCSIRIMIRVAFLSARTCLAVLLSFASSCVCGVVCENPRRSANTGTCTCGTKITF